MNLSDLKVVEVVSRRYLERPCSKGHVHVCITDHRDLFPRNREDHVVPDETMIPRIFRIDGNCGVSQHCLRTRRSNRYKPVSFGKRIPDVVEMPLRLLMFYLHIGKRGLATRAPVDNVVAAVDEPLFIESDKNLTNGPGKPCIHGKTFP